RGRFYNRNAFFRLIPELTHRFNSDTVARYSLGFGRDWFRIEIGDIYLATRNYNFDAKTELEHRFAPSWVGFFGADLHYIYFDYDFSFPRVVQTGTGAGFTISSQERLKANVKMNSTVPAIYTRQEWKPGEGPLTLIPGARLEYFNLTREAVPQPRAAARYQLTESLRLRTAGGLYVQVPQPNEIDAVLGNPDLKTERSWHYTLGAEQDFRGGTTRGFIVSSDFFYKPMSRLVIGSSKLVTRNGNLTPENFSNEGAGKAFGLSSMIRLEAHPFNGWISYTFSRSTRTEPGRGTHLFQFDQTHILSVLSSVVLAENWTFGARVRLVSGNPTTPILGGIWDSDADRYQSETGPFYSERLSPFFALDFRVDRKWVFENWIFSAYADIQNATNQKNREAVRYSYDYSQKEEIAGLPILPTLGVKGEF
ncbi:MAG: TonB-dependent receptor, partial [Bdellovibrionota bacterium]